jgi:uncharacterized protein YcfL
MKKLFFVCTVAVFLCSACKWFDNKPNNNIDQTVVVDSLQVTPDSVLSETPDSTAKGSKTPAAEKKEVATTPKPSGQ